jgi:large subunit ribosomal protein L35
MPKMKTHSSLKRRFKITGTGKVLRHKAFRKHLFASKSARQKRLFATQPQVAKGDIKRMKQQLANLK